MKNATTSTAVARLARVVAILAVVLATGSCVIVVNGDGSIFQSIALDQEYTDQSLSANGERFYTFTATKTGHGISVSQLTVAADWYLFADSSAASSVATGSAIDQSTNSGTTTESKTVTGLTVGTTYYLVVDEQENKAGSFTLQVTS